jgi:hypothetical protein
LLIKLDQILLVVTCHLQQRLNELHDAQYVLQMCSANALKGSVLEVLFMNGFSFFLFLLGGFLW